MVAWVNRAVFQAPRNGTTSHTIDPSSTVGLVVGAAFTPTAGRLLVVVVEGAVTSSTPSEGKTTFVASLGGLLTKMNASRRVLIFAFSSTLSCFTFRCAQRGEHTACIGRSGTNGLAHTGHGLGLGLNGFSTRRPPTP